MQKLLNLQQIRRWDQATITREPISSIDLMERAASRCSTWIRTRFVPNDTVVLVVAGTGNNGGDGLAIARHLHEQHFQVRVVICGNRNEASEDFKVNLERLSAFDIPVQTLQCAEDLPLLSIERPGLIVDAIFGSGLTRPVEGWRAEVLQTLNRSQATVVSIDLPSGLPADPPDNELFNHDAIVRATITLTFQVPKRSALFDPWGEFCGRVEVLDIGLDPGFPDEVEGADFLLQHRDVLEYLPDRPRFSHKGTYGKLLLAAGSRGMSGAAVLAAKAALRSGVGLVTVHSPKCAEQPLQVNVPEAMVQLDEEEDYITRPMADEKVTALAIGPGLGLYEGTAKAVDVILQQRELPAVIDADALNEIASHIHLSAAAQQRGKLVLTPHPGEFDRLFGQHQSEYQRTQTAKVKAREWKCVIVLKGAYTKVFMPDGRMVVNPTGSPAMATGGSGDVLTGLLGGLLAQGMPVEHAVLIGVFLHGYTGTRFEARYGNRGMTAGWLAANLTASWQQIQEELE